MIFLKKNNLKNKFDFLIAGLGNPGKHYLHNRHNIGRMVGKSFCDKHNAKIKSKPGKYHYAKINYMNRNILVVLPDSYMNNSGTPILKIVRKYNILVDNILVIVDEYNFSLGRIQLKSGGSDGGHNGVSSVIDYLGSNNFLRLRCGIGKNFKSGEMSEYVLSDFNEDEITEVEIMINNAVKSIETLIEFGKAHAMSLINSEEIFHSNNENINENND
jgi:peptidyl-tRNA hydrolase, PTH1 family